MSIKLDCFLIYKIQNPFCISSVPGVKIKVVYCVRLYYAREGEKKKWVHNWEEGALIASGSQ